MLRYCFRYFFCSDFRVPLLPSVASAEANLTKANKDLGRTTLTAPMDGVITALNAEIGEVVLMGTMNNAGTVLITGMISGPNAARDSM